MIPHPNDKPLTELLARCETHIANLHTSGQSTASGELALLIATLTNRITLAQEQAARARMKRSALRKAHRNLQQAYEGLLRWRDDYQSRQAAAQLARNARNIETAFPPMTPVSEQPESMASYATRLLIFGAFTFLAVYGAIGLVLRA